MEPVRRRRFDSCRACGWIFERAAAPAACRTCGAALQQGHVSPIQRSVYANDEHAHVASHIKTSVASARAPWAERLAAELEARHSRPRPEPRCFATSGAPSTARSLSGGRVTTMDALEALGGLRATPAQVVTRTALCGALVAALLAWIVL